MNLNGRLSFTGNVHGSMGAELVADVEANPSGSPSQTLVSIRVGDVIYSIPAGGGGGTSDYNALNNKPKVNNVTLSGDLTLADLGIQPAISFPGDGSKYLDGDGNFSTPHGAPDYSTSEVNTGQKWIDGKPVYQICYYIPSFPNASAVEYSIGISNIDTLISIDCIAESSSVALPLFYNAGNDNGSKIQIHMNDKTNGHIIINTFSDNRSGMYGTVIMRYTKTTD